MPCWRFQALYKIREPFTILPFYNDAVFTAGSPRTLVWACQRWFRNFAGIYMYAVWRETRDQGVGENCEFAAVSRYISETVQASTKVTIKCEYKPYANYQMVSFPMILNGPTWISRPRYFTKANVTFDFIYGRFLNVHCHLLIYLLYTVNGLQCFCIIFLFYLKNIPYVFCCRISYSMMKSNWIGSSKRHWLTILLTWVSAVSRTVSLLWYFHSVFTSWTWRCSHYSNS